VHGFGGGLGSLLTGVFASKAITGNPGDSGLLEGRPIQLLNQGISVLAAVAIALIGTAVLLKVIDAIIGLRVVQEYEIQGLDVSQHGEEGYIFY